MSSKTYTAHEMRVLADRIWDYETMSKGLELCDNELELVDCEATQDLIHMLRQAADMMEREAAKDAEIERLKEYIAENDINGDTAVACLTEIKEAVEEKMAEIERLRALVKELSDSLDASCDCHCSCDGCDMANESKFDCPDKGWRALVARARKEVK